MRVLAKGWLGLCRVGMVHHADAVPRGVHADEVRPQVVVRVVVQHDGVHGLLVVVDDLRAAVDEQVPADARPRVRVEAVELHRDEPEHRPRGVLAMQVKVEACRRLERAQVGARVGAGQVDDATTVGGDHRVVPFYDHLPFAQRNRDVGVRRVFDSHDVHSSPRLVDRRLRRGLQWGKRAAEETATEDGEQ